MTQTRAKLETRPVPQEPDTLFLLWVTQAAGSHHAVKTDVGTERPPICLNLCRDLEPCLENLRNKTISCLFSDLAGS